ncbi:putative mediator of RNA polymerase II transcription subunit 6-like isoform 1 [Capsicum annuum]|uniref:uncharacterized protein LOC107851404 n=1 Tax=Capsicum annuum TaxID=4072 RepID=UPI0007BED98D|nr:uncharacterized protein LOC107851404 [Capsicum annuum]KAF3636444.1 putative mediator of RNA polymerase II transcription subunit 6-like isoform 1 [Capsicum annuum]
MPMNKSKNTAGKTTARLKSTRKPLRDVSNSNMVKPLAASFKTKKIHGRENDVGTVAVENVIDRLLLVHSDFSSVIQQIDELVQVLKLGGKKSGKEIESFAHVLSEMQACLKTCVPKFQKALSDLSTRSEHPSEQSQISEAIPVVADNISDAVDSPDQSMGDSLVSPSPLVSWRAGCTTESGKLFLLTPLPLRKVLLSKCQESSKKFDKYASDTNTQKHPLFDIRGDMEDCLIEKTKAMASQPPSLTDVTGEMDILLVNNEVKSIPNEVSANDMPIKVVPQKRDCSSPVILTSQIDSSLLVMTPCLKMSPPKTCVLLEPSSEYNCRDKHGAYKMTPFPVSRHFSGMSEDSESSSFGAAEHLATKYPELFGIRLNQNLTNGGKVVDDESPDFLFSPPKTCVLMEPPVEEPLTNGTETGGNLDIFESTPMMTKSQSILVMGKHPGENTLKKELWIKFEAASRDGICFNDSTIQKIIQKDFLERLEEVSADEATEEEGA